MAFHKVDVQKRLDGLASADISDVNKGHIERFVDYCYTEGLGGHRILKYISILKHIAHDLDIDFEIATKEDIEKYVGMLERSDKGDWSKHDYKVALKKFYKRLNGEDEPAQTKWIKTTIKKQARKLPEDMITEDEVLKMVDATSSTRDKAIIALLWDVGARIGEVGGMRIKHIKFDEHGAIISLDGKTGQRRVRAVWSISYLMNWLEEHPGRNDPNAPLWINQGRGVGSVYTALRYDAIRMQLKRIAKKAEVNKAITPHLFRHSRATFMANHLTESQMDNYFGWVQGSGMPSIYVHLSGRDVDNAVLRANGIELEEDDNKPKVQKCPRCKVINTPNNFFCFKCGAALSLKSVMELEQQSKPAEEGLTKLMESKLNELVEARIGEILAGIK